MLLELTLYLLIGFMGLFLSKANSRREIKNGIVFVAFWPYFFLLKYVEFTDNAKRNSRNR
ncbi:hypothetical protein WQ57_07140 [Mesobacillus campisalis]|uniref:Uncharacterized protein n=1 Tax=Mesobacillus campisalis TaxID=1408103 RepID=A0A0M2SW02_9BACI|nr:hypothetical protein [Mesobacillus campisalis]KKK38754.1 hypothetical protein WQ57_07140 [Mesobacillus campisalis]